MLKMGSPDSRELDFVRCLKCFKILTCSRYDTSALLEHIRTDHPEIDIIDTDTKRKRSPPPPMRKQKTSLNSSKGYNDFENEIREYRGTDEDCISHYRDQNVHFENNENEHSEQHSPSQPQYVKDVDLSQHSVTTELLKKYPEIKESEFCPHNPNAKVVYTRRYKLSSPSVTASMDVLQSPVKRFKYHSSIEKWRPGFGSIYCPKCGMSKKPLIKSKVEQFTNNDCSACCLLSCWPFCFIPWLIPGQNVEYLYCANCKTFLGLYNPNTNCIKPNRLYVPTENDGHCVVRHKNSFENFKKTKQAKEKETQISDTSAATTPLPRSEPTSGGDSSATDTKYLPSIMIDGKELPPETVARIQKYKKYGSMLGIDLDALTDKESECEKGNKQKQDRGPSVSNTKK